MQAEAKPGAVLIAPSTRTLLAEVFELEPLGPSELKAPQQQKAATLALLANLLAGLARSGPVLMVVEDLHWVDPTTRELLDLIVGQVETLQALLLATFRPEIAAPWEGRGHVTPISLNRLGRAQTEALIAATVGAKMLPPEVVEQIAAKTDGVPPYIEELTKTVLESSNTIRCGLWTHS